MRHVMPLLTAAATLLSSASTHADLGDQLFKLLPSDGAVDSYPGRKRTEPKLPRKVKVYDMGSPGRRIPVKNVFYVGPYKDSPLGLLSALMEIKDGRQYL